MAATSTMLPLGTKAPDFTLRDVVSERDVSLGDFDGSKGMLVMFICNHCPYVQHVRDELARFGMDYQDSDLGIVAISANDADQYPDDGPDAMRKEAAPLWLHLPLPVRRRPERGCRLHGHVHARLLPVRLESGVGLSRPFRRVEAKQRDRGHRRRPTRGSQRSPVRAAGEFRAMALDGLLDQVEARQHPRLFGAA